MHILSSHRIAALSLAVTIIFLVMICKENKALESYEELSKYDDNDLPAMDESNGDEDDEKDLNFPFSEPTATYATTTTFPATKKRGKCSEDQIMFYLAELQVINPETIVQIATYKDLDRLCRKIAATLESIDGFMLTCIPLPQSHLYMQLITGVRVLHEKLCTHSDYQLAFQKYMSCFQVLHNEYIDCAGPADWTENMEEQELCNEYKAIADCYYTQTAMLCGIKAAKTMKELVVRVINAVIETHCPEVRKNPLVSDPMPEHTIYTRESSACKILSGISKLLVFFPLSTYFLSLLINFQA